MALSVESDFEALAILATFMVISEEFKESGLFQNLAARINSYWILGLVALAAGAFLMNDGAMYVIIPISVAMGSNEVTPLIAALVNLGSALTPFGNPQNVIIWNEFKIPLELFISKMSLGLALPIAVSLYSLKGYEKRSLGETVPLKGSEALVALASLIVAVALIRLELSYLALLSSFASYISLYRKAPKIEWKVLASLSIMIVLFKWIGQHLKIDASSPLEVFLMSVGLSQVISNVPATLILLNVTRDWFPLALGVNVGGLGTPIASLANVIAITIPRLA